MLRLSPWGLEGGTPIALLPAFELSLPSISWSSVTVRLAAISSVCPSGWSREVLCCKRPKQSKRHRTNFRRARASQTMRKQRSCEWNAISLGTISLYTLPSERYISLGFVFPLWRPTLLCNSPLAQSKTRCQPLVLIVDRLFRGTNRSNRRR